MPTLGPDTRLEIDAAFNRWMCFVDGENLTIRGQRFAQAHNFVLTEDAFQSRDAFLWIPDLTPLQVISYQRGGFFGRPLRSYYYTSVAGGTERVPEVRQKLWSLGFQPEVFAKRKKEEKAKGVDIALAKDFLSHAFLNNYDVGILFAGDADYLPLIQEVKRLGKIICVAFFANEGSSAELQLAADYFLPIDWCFENRWRGHIARQPQST